MNDQGIDERLARAGEQFRGNRAEPPSLDSMLDAALKPRHHGRVWLAVAATVVAVVGVAVVVPLARSSGNGHPSRPAAAAPSTIDRGGAPLQYAGDEAWSDPVLDETDPNIVYVYAAVNGGTASWGSYCEATPVARIVSQTSTAVTIAVGRYAAPSSGANVACADIYRAPTRLKVTLAQPLATRSLVDAYDGVARQVLDPTTVLKPSFLPEGYTGGPATWDDQHPGAAVRKYKGPGGSLTITVGPASLNRTDEHIIEHTTVRGHPATVSNSPGFEQDILVAWNEDATHAATVYQTSDYDKSHPPLTAEQLVQIANSLS
jgi:hypothetical protein